MKDVSTDLAALRASLAFPFKYLSEPDLRGKPRVLEISDVSIGDLPVTGGSTRKERKILVSFKGAQKQWVLNKTCARVISRLYGDEMRGWVGKLVELYPTTCEAFGDPETPCIRVKKQVPKSPPKQQPPKQ